MWRFDFETMDVYTLALRVARWVRAAEWPHGRADLRDQGIRAAESCVLNIAEGRMRGGKAGKNHMAIALGSAGEVLAVLDLVELPGREQQQELLRRVGLILTRLR
jgi:four helix bundle protein